MTPEDVRQAITGWCGGNSGLEYVSGDGEGGGPLSLRATSTTGGPIDLQVLHDAANDRVAITHTASISDRIAGKAQELLAQRPGWLTASVDRGDGGTSGVLQTHVYLDGFNRNSFMQAVAEVAHTARLLGGMTTAEAAAAAVPAGAAAAGAGAGSAAYGQQQSQYGQPSFGQQGQQQQQQAYSPVPQQGPAPWVPTHSVPPQGLRAWSAPDPNLPVVANLAPGLPIQVAEVRGAWARVVCSNGWAGWIDGRIIGVAA